MNSPDDETKPLRVLKCDRTQAHTHCRLGCVSHFSLSWMNFFSPSSMLNTPTSSSSLSSSSYGTHVMLLCPFVLHSIQVVVHGMRNVIITYEWYFMSYHVSEALSNVCHHHSMSGQAIAETEKMEQFLSKKGKRSEIIGLNYKKIDYIMLPSPSSRSSALTMFSFLFLHVCHIHARASPFAIVDVPFAFSFQITRSIFN